MKTLKIAVLLIAGIVSFQFANAQAALTNTSPCPVTFELDWQMPCSGAFITTSHTVAPGTPLAPAAAPAPGYKVIQARVQYGAGPVTTIVTSICFPGPGGGSVPATDCFGGATNVNWDDNIGAGTAPQHFHAL